MFGLCNLFTFLIILHLLVVSSVLGFWFLAICGLLALRGGLLALAVGLLALELCLLALAVGLLALNRICLQVGT